MRKITKVTIYITAHNHERAGLLKEAIQSALDQTYGDFKIIVLDNASMGESIFDAAASFGDKRIGYIRHERSISGEDNFNFAFDHNESEYFIVFHDDDIMFPWMIEEEAAVLDKYPDVGIVGCKPLLSAGATKIPPRPSAVTPSFYGKKEFVAELCRVGYNPLIPSCVLFRAEAMRQNTNLRHKKEIGPCSDIYLWVECDLFGPFKMCIIDEPLFQYRIHAMSGTAYDTNAAMREASAAKLDNLLREECPEMDLSRIWEFFVIFSLLPQMRRYINRDMTLDDLLAERKRIEDEHGWSLPDWRFEDKLAVSYLEDIAMAVKAGWKTVGDYLDAIAEAEKLGIRVSWKRHKMWFGDSYIQV
ncbi:MAG: glycosyltransferase family 2 protein [Synergistaceae bacterium]|nr:glycosyltransferase family 2 protein [Synergistaceae bacterium]